MRLGDGRIDRDRACGGGEAVVDVAPVTIAEARLGDREQRPGLRVIRIDLDRAAANPHHPLFAPRIAVIAGDPILPREQIELVGLDVGRAALLDRLLFLGQQLELQRRDDRLGNFVLDRENVLEVAVVTLGPDMIAARRRRSAGR